MDTHTPFLLMVAFTSSLLNRYVICGATVRYIGAETDTDNSSTAHTSPQSMEPAGCVVCPTDCSG